MNMDKYNLLNEFNVPQSFGWVTIFVTLCLTTRITVKCFNTTQSTSSTDVQIQHHGHRNNGLSNNWYDTKKDRNIWENSKLKLNLKTRDGVLKDSVLLENVVRHKKGKKRDRNRKRSKRNKNVKALKSKRRNKRHRSLKYTSEKSSSKYTTRKSCPTNTAYTVLRTAEDIFGDIVDVYPVVSIDESTVTQNFYESFCNIEECECAGIDYSRFKSSCQTTHGYTYARVIKNKRIGWLYIKVRTGCICLIEEKISIRPKSISDFLK